MSRTIVIPLEIPSQNETEKGRTHWARARATKLVRCAWYYATVAAMASAGVYRAVGTRALHVVAYRKRLCLDIANVIGGAKACVDGMVDAGLLVDDRDAKARITYQQEPARLSPLGKGVPCTVVVVEEVAQ